MVTLTSVLSQRPSRSLIVGTADTQQNSLQPMTNCCSIATCHGGPIHRRLPPMDSCSYGRARISTASCLSLALAAFKGALPASEENSSCPQPASSMEARPRLAPPQASSLATERLKQEHSLNTPSLKRVMFQNLLGYTRSSKPR